jgi:multimeric flavodoxin WrbA
MINGQNHKGSTYNIGKVLIDHLGSDHDVKEFFLPQELNHFCLGCYSCIEDETKCPFFSEKREIMKEVEQAELLIFTTPNYCMAPSAPLKAFIDLTFTYWMSHKPRACMFHKKAVVLSTTAGMGTAQAMKPVKRTLTYWGVPYIKSYGISVQAMNWNGVSEKKKLKISKDMKALAEKLISKGQPRVGLKTKLMFTMFSAMQKADMGSSVTEKEYWENQNWIGKGRPWKKQ